MTHNWEAAYELRFDIINTFSDFLLGGGSPRTWSRFLIKARRLAYLTATPLETTIAYLREDAELFAE